MELAAECAGFECAAGWELRGFVWDWSLACALVAVGGSNE